MIEFSGILKWDSNFFNFKVGNIKIGNKNIQEINDEIIRLQDLGCRLVYVNSPEILDLTKFKSVLVDKKRSYILSNPQYKEIKKQIVSVIDNPPLLYNLAYQAGEYSRYRVDPYVEETIFKKLYRTWIDNSINNGFADYVLAAIKNNNYIGLITAKKREHELSIGLFATDKMYRNEGIGSGLIQTVINYAFLQKLEVEVTTQADNDKACTFYQHKGFEKIREEYIYHVWLE